VAGWVLACRSPACPWAAVPWPTSSCPSPAALVLAVLSVDPCPLVLLLVLVVLALVRLVVAIARQLLLLVVLLQAARPLVLLVVAPLARPLALVPPVLPRWWALVAVHTTCLRTCATRSLRADRPCPLPRLTHRSPPSALLSPPLPLLLPSRRLRRLLRSRRSR